MITDKQHVLDHFAGDYTPFYAKYFQELKRSGKEYQALCPFHADKSPSLSINPESGLFHCHACSAGGDIFNFYSKRHNLDGDFPAIVQGICSDFGISTTFEPERS